MRTIQLLVVLLPMLLVAVVSAENYSCRDSHGRLHLSDNIANLPEDCVDKVQTHASDDVGTLNIVPTPDGSNDNDSSREFQQNVREAEQDLQKKQQTLQTSEQLQQRAEKLADAYESAAADKNQALKRWKYGEGGSRDTMEKSDKRVQQTREGKQQVLQELSDSSLSRRDKEKIEATLNRVAD